MSEKSRLTIGYSTLANRIGNIVFPSLEIPHEILISVQNPTRIAFTVPESKSGIRIIESFESGVTKSRNKVLEGSTTEYLLFADDDATINVDGVKKILDYLDQNPTCDLVTAMTVNDAGLARKRYSSSSQRLTLFNSAKVGTIEMVLRTDSARRRHVRFDENFGAGALNRLGDEYIFISDLLKSGGQGVFLPIVLASHPDESSGVNQSGKESAEDLMARAKVFTRVFGWKSPIIRAVFYIRRGHSKMNPGEFFRFVRG